MYIYMIEHLYVHKSAIPPVAPGRNCQENQALHLYMIVHVYWYIMYILYSYWYTM